VPPLNLGVRAAATLVITEHVIVFKFAGTVVGAVGSEIVGAIVGAAVGSAETPGPYIHAQTVLVLILFTATTNVTSQLEQVAPLTSIYT
jgi:hypothetical protein